MICGTAPRRITGTLREWEPYVPGTCVQAMLSKLWRSLGRALVALWQQCVLRGARLRRGARAILHDWRPAKMVCDCCDDGKIASAYRTQGFFSRLDRSEAKVKAFCPQNMDLRDLAR